MSAVTPNAAVAEQLRAVAELLEAQGANPFRVRAYRSAADTVEALREDLRELVAREGPAGLEHLPAIGESIAGAIAEILERGRLSLLERLRGAIDPERLFRTVPGIGPSLAERIHDELHVDTLEGLELAAHDGRLEGVAGIGPRRAAAIRASLRTMLERARPRPPRDTGGARREPSAAALLDVDREYRRRARAGELTRIAPRRFNPEGRAWLPILHTERDDWHFTALYSNTARAHELGRTDDWVVIYFYDDDHREGQRTVVTETRGVRRGERVVRGREQDHD